MTPVHELEAARAPAPAAASHTLPLGSRLREYEIKWLIGEGTCSIVYCAWDHSLQRKVAIKEYMPAGMAGRVQGSANVVVAEQQDREPVKAGLRSFINEARVLAKFDHPALVKVYRFWEDNGTAYMVMPYYEGPTLKAALTELGHVPSETELRTWLKPILNAVALLHDGGTWHQNIGPDEILLTPFGPVLLGFSAAAHAIEATRHTPAAALKPGYAAIEQYGSQAGSTRGPWTDLYALAATVYGAITGSDPVPAADRLAEDRLRPLAVVAAGLYSARFLAAIDAAMAVQPRRRPADHTAFRALMGDIDAPDPVSLAPRPDLMQEPFAGPAADDREVTVPDRAPQASVAPVASVADRTAAAKTIAAAPKTAPAGSADDADQRVPSWMQTARTRVPGKRALYGIVAGTCAFIGIAALVLQLSSRSAVRNAAPAAPIAARAALPVPAPAPTPAAHPIAAVATPHVVVAPAKTPATTPATTPAATAVRPRPASAPTTPTATRPVVATAAPAIVAATPLERQARCTEILQKASLEKITPAETEFFKRECK